MQVIPIPCLSDNYAYLLVCPTTRDAAVVDPSQAAPVIAEVERSGVKLVAILNTHHHWDHVDGNNGLISNYPDLRVYGYASDRGRIPGQTDFLDEDQTFSFGRLSGHITHNPGHTTGAITYYLEGCAFTGDTLFAAGCGRLFEGTPADMYMSLNKKIGSHPDDTMLYFGHEYTLANLKFAQYMEPGNPHISTRMEKVAELRKSGAFTTPSTLAEERQTNPFMRCQIPEIIAAVKRAEPGNDGSAIEVLRVTRALKDQYRG